MSDEQLLGEIAALPDDAKKVVADLVGLLRQRSERPTAGKGQPGKNPADSDFVGMWKDRADMADPDYLRKLRRREWREPS